MTQDTDTPTHREEIAAAFGRDIDPLVQYAPTFEEAGIDPFGLFEQEVLVPKGLAESTLSHYRGTFEDWRAFMEEQGRHPACPTEDHVRGFIRRELERNKPGTARDKLQKLNKTYMYWQADNALPHPQDFNPFELAKQKTDLSDGGKKPPHNISPDRLREIVAGVNHVRDRAYIVLPLKLGLRASEVANIQLQDVSIANPDLREHYPDLGTHARVQDRENAIYVPPSSEREGNKSVNPRVLPLDEDSRRVLLEWLLIRPDNGLPWVFLTKQGHEKVEKDGVNNAWLEAFRPEYDETDHHRAVTSHFGRHRFSTFWRVKEDAPREVVKYMRGDKTDASAPNGREAMDEYLHTFYEDIETIYRDRIFELRV